VRAVRGSKASAPRRNGFSERRQQDFLSHFAATCNAKASARAAEVAFSTVYAHRAKDPVFREAWNRALAQGYARLEAELVAGAAESLRVEADEEAGDRAFREIDAKTALAVLESYRRSGERRPGDILPRASDMEKVRARLEKKMAALGLIDSKGRFSGGEAQPAAGEVPAGADEG